MHLKKSLAAALIAATAACAGAHAQDDFEARYRRFRDQADKEYRDFRDNCNRDYAAFLRQAWEWHKGSAPIPCPKETPMPPRVYGDSDRRPHISVTPAEVEPVPTSPQPLPVAPVREVPDADDTPHSFEFFGIAATVRMLPKDTFTLGACTPDAIADAWLRLGGNLLNNTLRDCLEARVRYNLCDWAYLQFLDTLARSYCRDDDSATLLAAYLFCQSGYKMRLADDSGHLVLLFGTRHRIFDKGYFDIGGCLYYPLGDHSPSLRVCDVAFEGETPMSLVITSEPLLGDSMSPQRVISSSGRHDIAATSQVPDPLIRFYNDYPGSQLGDDFMTRWAIYANAPLAHATSERIYPSLRRAISGCTPLQATARLLDWVQTGFVYEYDNKVWGYDRPFFAEETLFYPYCDCEDRAVLFSRLVRDLVGLDVALVYYPGHLATAVCLPADVEGDTMLVDGRRFIVCDPTYIGAPVGLQMPDLDYASARTILLAR